MSSSTTAWLLIILVGNSYIRNSSAPYTGYMYRFQKRITNYELSTQTQHNFTSYSGIIE